MNFDKTEICEILFISACASFFLFISYLTFINVSLKLIPVILPILQVREPVRLQIEEPVSGLC
jgi:hypothetical protein